MRKTTRMKCSNRYLAMDVLRSVDASVYRTSRMMNLASMRLRRRHWRARMVCLVLIIFKDLLTRLVQSSTAFKKRRDCRLRKEELGLTDSDPQMLQISLYRTSRVRMRSQLKARSDLLLRLRLPRLASSLLNLLRLRERTARNYRRRLPPSSGSLIPMLHHPPSPVSNRNRARSQSRLDPRRSRKRMSQIPTKGVY